jgi:hypothetical protein
MMRAARGHALLVVAAVAACSASAVHGAPRRGAERGLDSLATHIDGPYHGATDRIAFNLQGQLRFGHDVTAGVANPEWFSVSRASGLAFARLHPRLGMFGAAGYDHAHDDFVVERAELIGRVRHGLHAHAGIFLSPLGHSNLHPDILLSDFAERSYVATDLAGVPHAQIGLGVLGARAVKRSWQLVYQLDAVTGYDDGMVMDAEGGTRVAEGRNNYNDNNGSLALAGRVALRPSPRTEIGMAAQSGIYNTTDLGGVEVDESRWAHVIVADMSMSIAGCDVFAETGLALVDIPDGLEALYAQTQTAASIEVARTVFAPSSRSWRGLHLAIAGRVDAIDYDRDVAGDSRHRASLSLNVRQMSSAVLRLGWYYELARDRFNNDTPTAGLAVTIASYF